MGAWLCRPEGQQRELELETPPPTAPAPAPAPAPAAEWADAPFRVDDIVARVEWCDTGNGARFRLHPTVAWAEWADVARVAWVHDHLGEFRALTWVGFSTHALKAAADRGGVLRCRAYEVKTDGRGCGCGRGRLLAAGDLSGLRVLVAHQGRAAPTEKRPGPRQADVLI